MAVKIQKAFVDVLFLDRYGPYLEKNTIDNYIIGNR